MNHTFIVQPGEWIAAGMMQDESGKEISMQGSVVITHAPEAWKSASSMAAKQGDGPQIINTYTITPSANPGAPTRWTAENPALGKLRGRFVFVDDTIVSVFDSEDGAHSGTELMKQMAGDKYVNVGVLLKQGKKIASWAYELQKKT